MLLLQMWQPSGKRCRNLMLGICPAGYFARHRGRLLTNPTTTNEDRILMRAAMAWVVTAFALALLASVAQAQQTNAGSPLGGGKRHHQQKSDTSSAPKADDKAYNAALKSLPNKPYDPWAGAR
jgi:hypothetical protein